MTNSTPFALPGPDGRNILGDRFPGTDRQLLFITGFLSKRWGNKSRALADLCRERQWGFCCFDFRGNGDSEGAFGDYTLNDWLDDARQVTTMLTDGPPLMIIGSSLGGWFAWVLGQARGGNFSGASTPMAGNRTHSLVRRCGSPGFSPILEMGRRKRSALEEPG